MDLSPIHLNPSQARRALVWQPSGRTRGHGALHLRKHGGNFLFEFKHCLRGGGQGNLDFVGFEADVLDNLF